MLAVSALGAFLAFVDSTIVNVVFPDIQQSFHGTSLPTLSWVLNGYNIVIAALLIVAGRSADLVGRRRLFVGGVVLFVVASAACAAAGSAEQLIAFRLLQGVGAAMLIPASLALVVNAFPLERRAHAIGLWGATAAVASGLGPPAGGALVALGSWRLAFLVNVPIGIATVVLARRTLVEGRASGRRRLPDLRGAVLLGVSLATLTLGLVQGGDWGWTSAGVLLSFLAAILCLAGYALSSRAHPVPLIDNDLLRQRAFVVANLATAVGAAGWFAYGLNHILWLRYVWDYSLLRAGLAVAPGAVAAAVAAAVLGRVADRGGIRTIVVGGALVWAVSLGWFYAHLVPLQPHFAGAWLVGQVISGIGVGATMPTLASAALVGVPGGRYATASAVNSSIRQIGAVVGVSVLVIIVGTPSPTTIVAALRHGWEFSAACFVITAAVALLLGRLRPAAHTEPERTETVAASSGPVGIIAPRRATDLVETSAPPSLFDVVAARDPSGVETLEVPAGQWLFEQGDSADGMYVVRSGRFEVVVDGAVVRRLGPGELVGELALLTGGRRSAGVRASRDGVVGRVSSERFATAVSSDAEAMRQVATAVARRLERVAPPPQPDPAPSVVAVVAATPDAPVDVVGAALADELRAICSVVLLHSTDSEGLERAELDHDVVLLLAPPPELGEDAGQDGRAWRDFCVRSADRVVSVVGPAAAAPVGVGDERLVGGHLVWAGLRPRPELRAAWHARLEPLTTHHVDPARPVDGVRALARRLAGRSPALVLAGGGARAFAHLGVLEVFEEAGLSFDRVAGTSSGAVVAALWATGRSAAEIDAAVYNEFVRHRLLGDVTLPTAGLIKGRRVGAALRRNFGDTLIEELDREFACVSVDLLGKQSVVHRTGRLADAVFASLRLPGVFAPMRLSGTLHVDGTVLDNLPVAALTERNEGPVVAVDISVGGGQRREGPPRMPSIGETLMRTMLLGGAQNLSEARRRADLVITPRTTGVGMLEWHEIDTARAAGRAAAEDALPAVRALLDGSTGVDLSRHDPALIVKG
ncbi:MAG TPA: DHA2 family efflux MFS transporter permease subunit [Motilibacteraceae bacterium]|nr:DHA2 family efflux MFS transporter permease subunit [Motilibacteraceae bacterium]